LDVSVVIFVVIDNVDCFVVGQCFRRKVVKFDAFGTFPKGYTVCRLSHHPTVLSFSYGPHADVGLQPEAKQQ